MTYCHTICIHDVYAISVPILGISYYILYVCVCVFYRQVSSATATDRLCELRKAASDYGVIGIDEGQFVSL